MQDVHDKLLPVTGQLHQSIYRLYQNMASFYEVKGEIDITYKLFRKSYAVARELFGGVDHPQTQLCIDILREDNFRIMARRYGDTVP